MKKTVVLSSFIFLSFFTFAQSPIGKNGKQFNCGVGLTGYGVPVYFGLDFGVHPDITLGVEMSYKSYNDTWYDGNHVKYDAHHNIIGLSGNMNYHFNTILEIPKNWDFYAGLNVGYSVWTSPNGYNGTSNSGLGLGLQVGGRYYFNNKLGINLELGGPLSGAGGKIGISYKL
jgi:outer membrane immunogenic protein